MKNKTLTKNMPNVKWHAIPPVRGPNPQGENDGNVRDSYKQMVTSKKSPRKVLNKVSSFVNGNQGWILLAILVYLIRYLQA